MCFLKPQKKWIVLIATVVLFHLSVISACSGRADNHAQKNKNAIGQQAPATHGDAKGRPPAAFSMNDLKGTWQIDTEVEWATARSSLEFTDPMVAFGNPAFYKQHTYIKLPPPWSSIVSMADAQKERFVFGGDKLSETDPDGKVNIKTIKSFTPAGPNMAFVVVDGEATLSTLKIVRLDATTLHLTGQTDGGKDIGLGIYLHPAETSAASRALPASASVSTPARAVTQLEIKELTDQGALATAAESAEDFQVRLAAVEKLTNEKRLTHIVNTYRDRWLSRPISERLANQREVLISQILRSDAGTDFWLRRTALEKLTDQSFIAEIARSDPDRRMRRAGVDKLTDQKLLTEIAETDEGDSVRSQAVEKLSDQAALARFAKSDRSASRFAAVQKLTDQKLLTEVADTDKDEDVRKAAKKRLQQLAPKSR